MKCVCNVEFVICWEINGEIYKVVDTENKANEIVEKINNNHTCISKVYYYPKFTIIKEI